MDAEPSELVSSTPVSRRARRSWSRAEKRRIVEEAFCPGASAADVARGYGLNANQVFNWRRKLEAPTRSRRKATTKASATAVVGPADGLLPVGIVVSASETVLGPVPVSDMTSARSATGYRSSMASGLIEIDLVCGTRLRVDASVDEHALRRVLSAVKAS